MRVVILGSGTSGGVPVIGCSCPVCTSVDSRNRRTRSSAAVEVRGKVLLIDTATDLRQQALCQDLQRVDAVLFTHAHADHLHGIDELRVFNVRHLHEIPCYANADTAERLRNYLQYIFGGEDGESFRPFLSLNEVDRPFSLYGVPVVPVPLWHGQLPVLGYRIGGLAYLTDVNRIPEQSWGLLQELELLVLDALRPRPHHTHFCLSEAVEVAERLRPKRTVLTHISHLLEHQETNRGLPRGVELAYDGQVFELADP